MIKSVSSLIEQIHNIYGINGTDEAKAKHAHVRYMFRGHGKAEWKLEPAIYRFNVKHIPLNNKNDAENDEDTRLLVEQHLFQDFKVMSAGIRSGQETDCDLYALQQHHGMPTRLLDWSNNPLAALYFAVSHPTVDDCDGAFFALDAYHFAENQLESYQYDNNDRISKTNNKDVQGVSTLAHPYIQDQISVISEWKTKNTFGRWAIALRPYYNHPRMSLQRSCFTFHVPQCRELVPGRFNYVERPGSRTLSCINRFVVKKECKGYIRNELAALGIDDFSIFGDMDHLAQRLKAAYLEAKSSCTQDGQMQMSA